MALKFTELEKRKAGEIGLRIREYRKKENLTQEELGQLIGQTRQFISACEVGRTLPVQEVAYKLAEVFQVPRKVFYFPRTGVDSKQTQKAGEKNNVPLPIKPQQGFFTRLKQAISILLGGLMW